MLHIDQHIFEEISRYEEGELEGAEREAVARKLQTEEVWRSHRDYYQTVVRAIGRATLAGEIERMQQQIPSAEDLAAVDALLDKDRRSANLRRTGWQFALLLLVAGIAFWLGRVTAPDPAGVLPDAPGSVEEEEVPIAAPGTEHLLKVPFVATMQSEKQVAWQIFDGGQWEYLFQNDHLKLFVPKAMEADFQKAAVSWMARETDGETKHFLKINDQYFRLLPGRERQPLMPVLDDAMLEILR